MARTIVIGMVILLALSSLVFAIHTPETRYSVEQTSIEQRDIYFTQNRYGLPYVKPLGGYGKEGASSGSFGSSGAEEGASVLKTNAFIPRGRDPSKISNYYSSARGYQIINQYVELDPIGVELTSRPQINGTPKGYARVISMKANQLYLPQATVVLRVRDLVPITPDYIYEAWLVDEDTATSMSLGIFQPTEISRVANLNYKNSIPLDAFESIVVTTEPFPDSNPGPGQVVLAGNIKQKIVRTP